jgi:hypothetical protein
MQNITSEEADRRRQEANNTESTEDGQSHILSGTIDGSEFNAKLATIFSTTMFPTNAIPTTTNVQPKHDATITTDQSIMSAKTEHTNQAPSQANQNKDDEDRYLRMNIINSIIGGCNSPEHLTKRQKKGQQKEVSHVCT